MIEIIPIEKDGLFKNGLTKKDIKKLTISNYCYSIDLNLLTKILSIVDRPIKSQKLFVRNILDFLNYLDSVFITEEKETINSEIFIRYFTNNYYIRYKDILSELEIITKVPHSDGTWYEKGKYSLKYKVHNKYLEMDELCLVVIGEGRKKYDRPMSIDDRLDLDDRYINTIDKLEINIVNAIEAEMNYCYENELPLSVLKIRLNRLFYLKQKRFIKKGNKVDRIYHSFTNISKVSRKHLNIKMNYIDLKNSQPLILVYYLINNGMLVDDNYKLDCEEGMFYERFYDLYNDIDIRTKIKQNIYKSIFFGFNQNSLVNKRFKELYPSTWSSLNDISKTDITLASRLQNIEAELFCNLVPKKSKNYFTLFDAIYFSDSNDIPYIIKEINDFFNNLGVKVNLEIG